MNRERAKELLPIIQAYADGKDIQYRVYENGPWKTSFSDSVYNFEGGGEYRIKPEPREFWLVVFGSGSTSSAKESEGEAETFMKELRDENPGSFEDAYVTKVREVTDD